jgi:hypothetical protein
VGAGGTILHYDGTIWTGVAGFTSTNLNSVFQLNPQQALAVGDSETILQWTGFSWLPVTPSPPIAGTPDLKSVFLVSPGFGLIVGGSPGAGSQATIIPVGQQTTNPIPEFHGEPVFPVVVLMTTLAIISRLRRRAPYTASIT